MLEFGGMRSNFSLPLFPGPPQSEVVALDGVLSMSQIEQVYAIMLN